MPVSFALLAAVGIVLFREIFLHPDQMLWGSDLVRAHTTCKAVQYRSIWTDGAFPLWDSTTLCGKSIVGDPLSGLLNPLAWLFWVTPSAAMFGLYLWAYTVLGAWGCFLWMRQKGAAPVGSLVAAIAFAFSGKTAAHVFAGHMELLPGMLCLPWAIWAAERILQHKSVWSAVLLGAVLTVTATLGSVQAVYYNVLAVGSYVFLHAIAEGLGNGWGGAWRSVRLTVLGGAVFVLGAMAWWLPIVRQTLLLSARAGDSGGGYEFATMTSVESGSLLRHLWPFNGIHPPIPMAHDAQNGFFWETASYPGLVALALALFLVVARPKWKLTAIFCTLTLVPLLLALGRYAPFHRWAYDLIPGFGYFRAPGRLLFYSNTFLAGMAGLGAGELLKGGTKARWIFAAVVGVLLMAASQGQPAVDPTSSNPAGGFELSIMVLLALLLVAVLYGVRGISSRITGALILGLACLDLGVVWVGHIHTAESSELLPSNSIVTFLEERNEERRSRYFDPTRTVPQQLAALHGLETITGYHPGIYKHQLEAYQALWPEEDGSDLVQLLMHSPADVSSTPMLDLMNVRYVVAYEPDLDERFVKVFTTPDGEFDKPRHVYERTNSIPRAFVVGRGLSVRSSVDSLERIRQLDVREACLMEGDPVEGGAQFQPLTPTLEAPGRLEIDFETEAPGVLVVSESWHPDWVATDHGEQVPVRRTNHAFLGIPVGAGSHAIRIRYRPWDFYAGCGVSGIFWVVLGSVGLVMHMRRRNAQRPGGAAPASCC